MKLYDAKGTVRAQSNVRDLVFLTSVGDQALIDLACDSKGTRSPSRHPPTPPNPYLSCPTLLFLVSLNSSSKHSGVKVMF
ncbi:uncharacterized [Tachysurus ichikawai]